MLEFVLVIGEIMADDNTVYIGNKQVMNYVTAVMTQFNEGDLNEVELMARGRAISRAVDVAEITRNRFLPDVEVESIETGTEEMDVEEGGTKNVSSIAIKLVR